MDTAIKVLTIIKLLLHIAILGLVFGAMLYFLLNNPIPKLVEGIQEQILKAFMSGAGG